MHSNTHIAHSLSHTHTHIERETRTQSGAWGIAVLGSMFLNGYVGGAGQEETGGGIGIAFAICVHFGAAHYPTTQLTSHNCNWNTTTTITDGCTNTTRQITDNRQLTTDNRKSRNRETKTKGQAQRARVRAQIITTIIIKLAADKARAVATSEWAKRRIHTERQYLSISKLFAHCGATRCHCLCRRCCLPPLLTLGGVR